MGGFEQISECQPQPTCFAKGNPVGRRIDYVFVNSQAVSSISSFSVDHDTSIPTHRPLVFRISIDAFSSAVSRLSIPTTCYGIHSPSHLLLSAFARLFQWDITNFGMDVEAALLCWNDWAQPVERFSLILTFTLEDITHVSDKATLPSPNIRKDLLLFAPLILFTIRLSMLFPISLQSSSFAYFSFSAICH